MLEKCYPEVAIGGFTRCDGTIAFYTRVQALVSPEASLLELGCGRGLHQDDPCAYRRDLHVFKGRCRRVVGVDVDPDAAGNPFIDEFRLIQDTSRWPVDDASFQIIVCDYVLEHVPNPDEFFREVRRVLAPGGYLCLRTVNTRSYISVASRMIPNRLHRRVLKVAQEHREERDVFPTVYRCNTKGRVERALRANGLIPAVYRIEPEPGYFNFSRLAYRLAVFAHAHMPAWCRSTLLVYARRPN
jgi:SAM-dependent methyltransferase